MWARTQMHTCVSVCWCECVRRHGSGHLHRPCCGLGPAGAIVERPHPHPFLANCQWVWSRQQPWVWGLWEAGRSEGSPTPTAALSGHSWGQGIRSLGKGSRTPWVGLSRTRVAGDQEATFSHPPQPSCPQAGGEVLGMGASTPAPSIGGPPGLPSALLLPSLGRQGPSLLPLPAAPTPLPVEGQGAENTAPSHVPPSPPSCSYAPSSPSASSPSLHHQPPARPSCSLALVFLCGDPPFPACPRSCSLWPPNVGSLPPPY